ncbi:hypothetical protein ACFW04_005544 [Cataglyphis niger]
MKFTYQDKKFQSSWKLSPSSVDLGRKNSAMTMTCPKCLLLNNNENGVISGLPEFECGVFVNFYTGILVHAEIFLVQGELPKLKEPEARGAKCKSTSRCRIAANLEAHSLGDITQTDEMNNFVEWYRRLGATLYSINIKDLSFILNKRGIVTFLNCRTCVTRNNAFAKKNAFWLYEEKVPSVLFPRNYFSHRLCLPEGFSIDPRLLPICSSGSFARVYQDTDTDDRFGRTTRFLQESVIESYKEFVAVATHEDIDIEKIERLDASGRLSLSLSLSLVMTLEKLKTIDSPAIRDERYERHLDFEAQPCCGNGIVMSLKRTTSHGRSRRRRRILLYRIDIYIDIYFKCFFPLSSKYIFSIYYEAFHICNISVQEKYDDEKRCRQHSWRTGLQSDIPENDADHCSDDVMQSHMEKCRSSFELCGDFTLVKDTSVRLIEINTNLRTHPHNFRMTKLLYAFNVLKSLVKDDLVYKQNILDFQPYFDSYLFVAGKSMTLYKGRELKPGKERRANICGPWSKQQRARIAPPISYARESRTSTLLTT